MRSPRPPSFVSLLSLTLLLPAVLGACGGSAGSGSSGELDLDADGIPDSLDPDIDGDGFFNPDDAFPFDPLEFYDSDGDGIGNLAQLDEDGDGVPDSSDMFPLDPSWTTLLTVVETEFNGNLQLADPIDAALIGGSTLPPGLSTQIRSAQIEAALGQPFDVDFFLVAPPLGKPITILLEATAGALPPHHQSRSVAIGRESNPVEPDQ